MKKFLLIIVMSVITSLSHAQQMQTTFFNDLQLNVSTISEIESLFNKRRFDNIWVSGRNSTNTYITAENVTFAGVTWDEVKVICNKNISKKIQFSINTDDESKGNEIFQTLCEKLTSKYGELKQGSSEYFRSKDFSNGEMYVRTVIGNVVLSYEYKQSVEEEL